MQKNIFLLILLFAIISAPFLFHIDKSHALPSNPDINNNAGHKGLAKMSIDIKETLPESQSNGLMQQLIKYYDTIHISNVSEDGAVGMYGALHFYDPASGEGLLGIFPNAKDNAYDWYNQALSGYCFSKQNGLPSKGGEWNAFGHVLHLMQDMTTPAHTNNNAHISAADSYEKYVADNWDQWATSTLDEGKIQKTDEIGYPVTDNNFSPVYYSGLKEYLEDYISKPYHKYYQSTYMFNGAESYFDYLARDSKSIRMTCETLILSIIL